MTLGAAYFAAKSSKKGSMFIQARFQLYEHVRECKRFKYKTLRALLSVCVT
jgi:hypothetical protein